MGLCDTNEMTERAPSWGFWPTVYVRLMNAMKRVFGLHLYGVYAGPHGAGEMPALSPELELHILNSREIWNHVNKPGLDFREASISAALARGDLCVGAFKGKELIAYSWRTLQGPVPHTGGWEVTWKPGLVYRYKALTLPEYRGLHINEALAKTLDGYLANQGHTMGLAFVETHNLSSIRTVARKGRQRIGYAGYVERFGMYVPFRTWGCRRVGFAFRRAGVARAN